MVFHQVIITVQSSNVVNRRQVSRKNQSSLSCPQYLFHIVVNNSRGKGSWQPNMTALMITGNVEWNILLPFMVSSSVKQSKEFVCAPFSVCSHANGRNGSVSSVLCCTPKHQNTYSFSLIRVVLKE